MYRVTDFRAPSRGKPKTTLPPDPDTGICVTNFEEAACCGGPAPAESDACCVADVVAKDVGEIGRIGARALTNGYYSGYRVGAYWINA